jgi:hypothetical protein
VYFPATADSIEEYFEMTLSRTVSHPAYAIAVGSAIYVLSSSFSLFIFIYCVWLHSIQILKENMKNKPKNLQLYTYIRNFFDSSPHNCSVFG